MYSYYIIIVSIVCISILHAADNNESNVVTFKTYHINSSNIERNPPEILHSLDLNRKETNTKKTFRALCDEAHKKGLPWILTPCIIVHPKKGLTMEYLDTVELLRKEPLKKLRPKLLSETMCHALLKFASEHYGSNSDVAVISNWSFYPLGTNKSMIPVNEFTAVYASKAKILEIADTSIGLAIRLHNDYNELKQLVRMPLVVSAAQSFSQNNHNDSEITKAAHNISYILPEKEVPDADKIILTGFCSSFWKKYYENLPTDIHSSSEEKRT